MDEQALRYVKLGLESLELGNFDQAVKHFDIVLGSSDVPRIKLLKGIALQNLEHFHEAEEVIEDFLQIEPENLEARETLSQVRASIERIEVSPTHDHLDGDSTLHRSAAPVILGSNGILFNADDGSLFGKQQSGVKSVDSTFPATANTHLLAGEWLSLCGPWANTFFHWFMEMLPQLLIAEQNGFSGKYLINPEAQFVRQSLELIGISPSRFEELANRTVELEQLIIPRDRDIKALKDSPEIFGELRARILSHLPSGGTGSHRLYISRNGAHGFQQCWRKIVNETELEAGLEPYGFETVHLEELSLREQIKLTSSAEAVVTPHGAGLTHTLFLPTGSLVIELLPPTYVNYCFLTPIKMLKHRYYPFTAEVPQLTEYKHGVNVRAPIDCVTFTLERELGAVRER